MKKLLSILVLSVACVTALHAEGFYTQFELGAGRLHGKATNGEVLSLPGVTSYESAKKDHFVAAVAVGYQYDLNEDFSYGAELGYKHVGKDAGTINNGGELSQQLNIVDALVVGTYHVNSELDAFGKFGGAFVGNNVSLTTPTRSQSITTVSLRPELALGAGYSVMENVQVIATLSHIFGEEHKNESNNSGIKATVPSVTMATVGLKYMF
ncbi:outer membrane beta-barrel protein [Kiloniella litopenaei]|uniref:outer membrane beta-barrel protein n=1 Tax=Kiloniella litopenaei TaxID=1549748 RepID=UPI003BAA1D15